MVFVVRGVCVFLGHLAWEVFEDSGFFPMALTAIGLLIIYLGVLWQKHEKTLSRKARGLLPSGLQQLLNAPSR